MSDDDVGRPDLFAQPDPTEFDYRPLLESLRECRMRLGEIISRTGPRNPLRVESANLLSQIDSVARLTRVPGALKFVRRRREPKEQH
jgi:hypothetical protein